MTKRATKKRDYILQYPDLTVTQLQKQAETQGLHLSNSYIHTVRNAKPTETSPPEILEQAPKRVPNEKLSQFCRLALQLGLDTAQRTIDKLKAETMTVLH